jgi:hypothetical protein
VANGLFTGIQPIRVDLFKALLEQDCKNSTYITVFDVAVGSISGGGSFNLILGGVQATSGDALTNQYCLGCNGSSTPILGGNNSNTVLSSGATNTGKASGTPAASGSTGAAAPAVNATTAIPASSNKGKGARGGALAGVGLASLGLLGAMAEGDRRKMRRAQREIPQFEE